ncbi:acyl-CoA thioesterase [Williamsia muralis]|uniref:acyl-CoA thioesterase n=1 Tax=Williamsia marianensis TaxID=85044 RepID=UPI0037FB368D
MNTSASALGLLVDALDLRDLGSRQFLGPPAERRLPRLFGGHVLAQALIAGGRTVPGGRQANSVHALFLRGGDSTESVEYEVDVLRDGRSFSARAVTARQAGQSIATVQLSFAAEDTGPEHQMASHPAATPPEHLPDLQQRLRPDLDRLPSWWTDPHPFDIRFVDVPDALAAGGLRAPEQEFWLRAAGDVPEDPLCHAALLTYASDLNLLDPALLPHARSWYGSRIMGGASVDHAMWFHRPVSIDEWILCRQESPVATRGRCLCTATFDTAGGILVASAAQEGVLREPAGSSDQTGAISDSSAKNHTMLPMKSSS